MSPQISPINADVDDGISILLLTSDHNVVRTTTGVFAAVLGCRLAESAGQKSVRRVL